MKKEEEDETLHLFFTIDLFSGLFQKFGSHADFITDLPQLF